MVSYPFHPAPRRVVITGGPGAGKTAVLELARRDLCRHVDVLPEAASIVFSGGFPRRDGDTARRCAQRAIYRVQHELETMALADDIAVALCDRGTLDALAYWPGSWNDFFAELETTMEKELARYAAVIHLRVPSRASEYRQTELRHESHAEAREVDARLFEVWARHPRRIVIDGAEDFMIKAEHALVAIRAEVLSHACDAPGSAP
jgi:predicted ATPase